MKEETSVSLYQDKKVFARIGTTITKLLTPTKIGINGFLISRKRTNLLKAYETYQAGLKTGDDKLKEGLENKYEESFSLYLESIDKYMMDNVYKKVRNDTASEFEKIALSKYYNVVHLKDSEYLEYKYKKQIFLMQLDYETIKQLNKDKLLVRYENFYATRMETLYKKILKNYSIKLSTNLQTREKEEVFDKIFDTLEEYLTDILPLKMIQEPDNKVYKEILDDYHNFEKFAVGKLDQNDVIEKNMILLGISRKLFVHSLPLVVAEQCYEKLIEDARFLIMDSKIYRKQEKAYSLLINTIEDYNLRVLSTKIYWDKAQDREDYKKFWAQYEAIAKKKEVDFLDYSRAKETLFLKNELKYVLQNENRYYRIVGYYKHKLVELGAMRSFKDSAASINLVFTSKQKKRVNARLASLIGE